MLKKLSFLPFAQLFLSSALLFGTWVIYIPTIIEKLGMSKGELGVSLSFSAIGSLIATPVGKIITNRFGEGKISFYGALSQTAIVICFFIAPGQLWLSLALFAFGLSSGILQVGVNSLVTTIERDKKVSIMSTCHGFFSLGGLIAAGFGSILLFALSNPLLHILIAVALVVILQIFYKNKYYLVKNNSIEKVGSKKTNVLKNKTIWILAIIALSAFVSEGAIADWSGLFLKDVALADAHILGLGYAGFSLSMTSGRFIGDYFSRKFGSGRILVSGFFISLIGFSMVLIAQPVLSIIGFIIIGAGFSVLVPEAYRMSANTEGVDPASGIAFLAGAGSVGFLAGPVVLGIIAENFGLANSFIAVAGLVIVGATSAILITIKTKSTMVAQKMN
jgi:predicted MFS family arabinose efflux permease